MFNFTSYQNVQINLIFSFYQVTIFEKKDSLVMVKVCGTLKSHTLLMGV